MLFSKENYFNQMQTLNEFKRQIKAEPGKAQVNLVLPALQQKINHAELAARQAGNEYRGHIEMVNQRVD